jgi:VCBS repeat-containing protein
MTSGVIFQTVWDGGGHDTYDFSNYTTNLTVSLDPGGWTTVSTTQLAHLDFYGADTHLAAGNIANALLYNNNTASLIENAIGGIGNDTIVGNIVNNIITGGAGDDYLDGKDGADTANYSGLMSNFLWTHNADDSWSVTGSGIDTLWNIEYLQFDDGTVMINEPPPPPPVNTVPVITSGAQSFSFTEWADKSIDETRNTPHTGSGSITFVDPDVNQTHTATVQQQGTNYLGTFTINNVDNDSVDWTFTVSDSALDYLKKGQRLTQNYDVTIDDEHGGVTSQTIKLTLLGVNDAKAGGKPGGGNADHFDIVPEVMPLPLYETEWHF